MHRADRDTLEHLQTLERSRWSNLDGRRRTVAEVRRKLREERRQLGEARAEVGRARQQLERERDEVAWLERNRLEGIRFARSADMLLPWAIALYGLPLLAMLWGL